MVYLRLGPGRTLAGACELLYAGKRSEGDARRIPGHVRNWCAGNGWVERCAAWDAKLDQERLDAAINEARRDTVDMLREAREAREAAHTAFMAALDRLEAKDAARAWKLYVDTTRTICGEPERIERHEQTGKGGTPLESARSVEEEARHVAGILGVLASVGAIPPGPAQEGDDAEAE